MRLNRVRFVTIPYPVVYQTLEILREFGALSLEGLVLWLGHIEDESAEVQEAYVPDQTPISNEGGVGYFVEGEVLFKLNRALEETGLRLIAQVHSHPEDAYHSETDDRYAIVTSEGGFSLVVPNFGEAPANPVAWAVYRLFQNGWRQLRVQEIEDLFKVVGA